MYNGIGLQTPRGSGTNGYIQSNKFFVRPKTGKDGGSSGKGGFGADQGTGGISKKPNRDILEHDRKRQIQLKLVVLEDKLIEQGYTEAEISDKLEETRMNLEAAAASADDGGPTAITKVSDTQTHQIAARKEKKMEALRAALGITTSEPDNQKEQSETPYSDSEEGEIDEKPRNIPKKSHNDDDMLHDKDAQGEKDDRKKDKERKNDAGRDGHDKSRSKTQESKRRGHNDDSSDTDSGTKQVQGTKKKHLKSGRHSDSDSDSDIDVSKKTMQKSTRKQKQSRRHDSDDSDSDDGEEYEKTRKRHASDDDDGSSSDEQRNRKTQKGRRDSKLRRRHDSEDESDSDSGEKIRRYEVEGKKNAHRESHRTEKEKSLSYEQTKIVNARHEKTGGRYHVEGDSDSDRARKDKKGKVEKSRKGQHDTNEVDPDTGYDKKFEKTRKSRRHDTDEDDSDTGYDKKFEKTRKSRRHDTHEDDSDTGNGKKIEKSRRHDTNEDDSDTGNGKKIEKTQKSRRHDTDEDDSDDSKSDVSYGRSIVSDSDSDGYGYKKIDKSKLEKKNRGGNGNDLSKHESSREEKRLLTNAVGNDDKRNTRSGINNASDGLDALKKLEELYQSRRETEGGSRYGGHETMRGKRKVEDGNQDEQPESKSRSRNVEREAEHKKVESETKSISYKDRDDQRKDDYPRLNRSGGGHDVENIERGARVHGRSELHLDSRRGDRNRNEDEHRERKHTRDEGEVYGRHGRDEDRQHGSRRRVREEEEERGGRRDERGRQLDSSKRVKYDDYRSSERRRYDNDKRDDGWHRR